MSHVCHIDETAQSQKRDLPLFRKLRRGGIHRAVFNSHLAGASVYEVDLRKVLKLPVWLWLTHNHPSHSRRKPVDVKKTVEAWAQWIPRYALSHDVDAKDKADAQVDELLSPILAAPVAQLREFFALLVDALKNDPKVPYIIWKTYELWHDKVIKPAKKTAIIELKKKLAEEIVSLVDPDQPDIKKDLRDSMINALMWREPQQLTAMKKAVTEAKEEGIRPQVKGRQSCLFLQVPDKKGKVKVEVML